MREITGQLTPELSQHYGAQPPAKAKAFCIATYKDLVHHIARLSCLNKDHVLLYRGQNRDYLNKANASTFYPSIYRGDRISKNELQLRIDALNGAAASLTKLLIEKRIEGATEVRRRRYVQWSILQHYEVCATPLIDFTQSLRVACSFALDGASEDPYVYVFGLPYLTNRISVNSEHDLVNIRLLSICPPDALRPYFQEGYLAGTDESLSEFESKSDLDFRRRLVAKFVISKRNGFWGKGFAPIPRDALYPSDDKIWELCKEIGASPSSTTSEDIGNFLKEWSRLETFLLSRVRSDNKPVFNIVDAINAIRDTELLDSDLIDKINSLRELRNKVVHDPLRLGNKNLKASAGSVRALLAAIDRKLSSARAQAP